MKPIAVVVILLSIAVLLIPTILVLPFSLEKASGKLVETTKREKDLEVLLAEASPLEVTVYRTEKGEVETLPLEQYVAGVVASEMPAVFEEEALKAQSLAARTYIVRQLLANEKTKLPKGAIVGDTQQYQVYKDEEQLKEQWESEANYKKNMNKIRQAVYETRGQIIIYQNEPITPSYFSTSNGFTENSEAYWTNAFPYLKTVESPWDLHSPKYLDKKIIPVKEFEKALGVKLGQSNNIGQITARTPGNRVAEVKINNKTFTGREIREKLELKSADFTWERKGEQIIITTKGYGHGVGMSQYGANGMATEGKSYDEIIKYYYKNVEISEANHFLEKQIAKK
ncbi:stage II sporulation protein D [Bacillus kwashiorkori]|uniref:stage II sporulation protein D n=1 Tax=Bacillus kwashiorkori TaxID=1522318 RepID=UPI0023B06F16|nr:stage II sporulation protein D [Bacillus kwashiorkori]